MSPDGIYADFGIAQAETLILKESRVIGLEKHEGLTLQGVKIDFEKVDHSKKKICNPNIDDECILHIQLRDTSLISGVKLYFATLVSAMNSSVDVSPLVIFLISLLYPIIMFTVSLVLVIVFFMSELILSMVFGPILFTAFVVPSLFWITRRNRDQKRKKIEGMKSKLSRVFLFKNKNETLEYLQLVSGRDIFGLAMSFTMYIVLVVFLALVSIFGSGN